MPYGAFCSLSEYAEVEGFLHISEVAPRWIKNIHEFISEGQRHVVKVHHVDPSKNQVDVSIKRVNDEERKIKLESVQSEKKGRKLLEHALKNAKLKIDFETAKTEIEKHHDDIYSFFREISLEGEQAIDQVDLPKALKAQIIEIAKKSIKKPVIEVDCEFSLVCYGGNGVETIRKILDVDKGVSVHYMGAPKYKISLVAPDYKTGEKKLSALLEDIKAFAQKNHCDFHTERR
ncbi:S1 RNA-binding domain-containing protein [Candidatus Micrarchaeota archaeon]|nr:S1 RNA-binding domain-containing protein [Candidatus Micrarchaeota archaeon]